ncbi:hypothetical protein KC331_g17 [Hortaea werneckii]|nr:hypothetical protein KC331_g17 [Hortaea werneckii]
MHIHHFQALSVYQAFTVSHTPSEPLTNQFLQRTLLIHLLRTVSTTSDPPRSSSHPQQSAPQRAPHPSPPSPSLSAAYINPHPPSSGKHTASPPSHPKFPAIAA